MRRHGDRTPAWQITSPKLHQIVTSPQFSYLKQTIIKYFLAWFQINIKFILSYFFSYIKEILKLYGQWFYILKTFSSDINKILIKDLHWIGFEIVIYIACIRCSWMFLDNVGCCAASWCILVTLSCVSSHTVCTSILIS